MRSMLMTAVATIAVASLAFAAEAAKNFGNCPVSGGPAKEDVTMDYKGKKVHFCCDGCPGAVEKNPEKFTAKIHQQLLVTGQMVQVGCPFSGGKVNDKTMVELGGAKFAFCCANCQKKFNDAADDAKVDMIFAKIDKGFTLQDKCPVSGKPINIAQKTDYNGKTVYFCCGGCPAAFKADPEKFAANLPSDG